MASLIPRTSKENARASQGFTLLEVLMVMAIAAILMFIATPSYHAYAAQANAKLTIQTLSGLVRLARNHAIYRQHATLLCPSKDGRHCSQNWQEGVLIFQDDNHNKQVDSTETVIHVQAPLFKQGSLQWTAVKNQLHFSAQGISGSSAGSFIYCSKDKNPHYAHALILSFSGKIRHAKDSNNDGIRESGNAKNIVCS